MEVIEKVGHIVADGTDLGEDRLILFLKRGDGRHFPLKVLVGQHQSTIHEVAKHCHQFIIIASLEIAPRKVIILGLRSICGQDIAEYILLAREVA